tara:strand:- start:762 stop:965 length:204 start_codon:yes stop_codon:yes gene_type:complete
MLFCSKSTQERKEMEIFQNPKEYAAKLHALGFSPAIAKEQLEQHYFQTPGQYVDDVIKHMEKLNETN